MTDPTPPIIIPPEIIEKLPCNDVKQVISRRDHRLNVYIGLAATALGFAVFIAVQAPIRQEMIITNQRAIISTLEKLETEIQSLSRELERSEDHDRRE